jgi:hypothetical protein
VLENPTAVLLAQQDRARVELLAELKAQGVEYEERLARLAEVTHPKPLAEYLYRSFDTFRSHHPWVGSDNVRPKSVTRDLYERAMTFREYVNHYGLKRTEGLLLRYLSDTYKALVQTVPEPAKTDAVQDLAEWLGSFVRQVDSSLLDEWERLRHPDPAVQGPAPIGTDRPDVTANRRAFQVMIRNELFRWVTLLARRAEEELAQAFAGRQPEWTASALREAMAPYWQEHDRILIDADARNPALVLLGDPDADGWPVTQVISDPEGQQEWRIRASVDLGASREEGRAVLHLVGIAA